MPKKIIITEQQLSLIEMAYPTSFDMKEFKNLTSFAQRIKYCGERLKRLGSGSSRIVYQIDNEKVIKLAKNKKGLAQNQAEDDYYLSGLNITANVYENHEDWLWIESELARKIKESDFMRLLGYDFALVCLWVDYIYNEYSNRTSYVNTQQELPNGRTVDEVFDEFLNGEGDQWEWFNDLASYLRDYQLSTIGDLQRLSSWGIVTRNGVEEIVLVDYGLNDDVYKTHYR